MLRGGYSGGWKTRALKYAFLKKFISAFFGHLLFSHKIKEDAGSLSLAWPPTRDFPVPQLHFTWPAPSQDPQRLASPPTTAPIFQNVVSGQTRSDHGNHRLTAFSWHRSRSFSSPWQQCPLSVAPFGSLIFHVVTRNIPVHTILLLPNYRFHLGTVQNMQTGKRRFPVSCTGSQSPQ